MYRFLLTPRWLAGAALAVAAAVVMVFLGDWQLHRYHERSAINARIDAADTVQAVPLTSLLTRPSSVARAGRAPGKDVAWTKISVTGSYDPGHEIQARARTVNGDVGFEIVTPLVLADGTAVLVDRGWIPAPNGSAELAPQVPPAPTGQVSVVGQIHLSESRPTPIAHRDGRLDTRRISVTRLAPSLPYPVYGAYVLLTGQTPAADPAFTAVPIDHEDAWQNAGYTVQWWLFAAMALFAFGWQARKEAQGDTPDTSSPGSPWADLPALTSSASPLVSATAQPATAQSATAPSATAPSVGPAGSLSGSRPANPASPSPASPGPASPGPASPGPASPGPASSGPASSRSGRIAARKPPRSARRSKPSGDRVEESDRRAAEARAAQGTPASSPSDE